MYFNRHFKHIIINIAHKTNNRIHHHFKSLCYNEPLSKLILNANKSIETKTGNDNEKYDEFSQSRQAIAKQISNPFGFLAGRSPCECHNGVCGCCTGMLFSALRQLGCLNITYDPENFAFEFEMLMNNAVLYKNRVTGRNPPPVCARMPGISFIRLCASFYDLYFVGRNMHVCLEMSAFFQDSEILNRCVNLARTAYVANQIKARI